MHERANMTEAFQDHESGDPIPHPPILLAEVGGIATAQEITNSIDPDTNLGFRLKQHHVAQADGEVAVSSEQLKVQRSLLSVVPREGTDYTACRLEANSLGREALKERLAELRAIFDFGVSALAKSQAERIKLDDLSLLLGQLTDGLSPQMIIENNNWTPQVYLSREKSLIAFLVKAQPACKIGDRNLLPQKTYIKEYQSPELRKEREDKAADQAKKVLYDMGHRLSNDEFSLSDSYFDGLLLTAEKRLDRILDLRASYGENLAGDEQYREPAIKFLYTLDLYERRCVGRKSTILVTRHMTERYLMNVRRLRESSDPHAEAAAFYLVT